MKRRIGLLAPAGAAVVALVCLLALQTVDPPASLAKAPNIGTVVNGDPDDGEHRQFTDEVRATGVTNYTASTPTAPSQPGDSPSPTPSVQPQTQARSTWEFLISKGLVRQALWLVLGW